MSPPDGSAASQLDCEKIFTAEDSTAVSIELLAGVAAAFAEELSKDKRARPRDPPPPPAIVAARLEVPPATRDSIPRFDLEMRSRDSISGCDLGVRSRDAIS